MPARKTLAFGEDNSLRLFNDCSALTVWTVPKTALIVITIKITNALSKSPKNPDINAAEIKIITKKSLNCSKNIIGILLAFASTNLLRPYFS